MPALLRREPAKKALLIGIQYNKLESWTLDGPHRDVGEMRKLLVERFGYLEENIQIMLDDSEDNSQPTHPSKANIMRAMKDLVHEAQPKDHFVFLFAGHGSQVPRDDGSESDNLDEVIWPVDVLLKDPMYDGEVQDSFIIDDDLKKHLADSLPAGCTLTAILDCCHSGTGMDLPNATDDQEEAFSPISPPKAGCFFPPPESNDDASYAPAPPVRVTRRARPSLSLRYRKTSPGAPGATCSHDDTDEEEGVTVPFVTSWSACLDQQVGLEHEGGRLIHHLIKMLRRPVTRDLTYEEVYNKLVKSLAKDAKCAKEALDLKAKIKPQLGSSYPLNKVWKKRFHL